MERLEQYINELGPGICQLRRYDSEEFVDIIFDDDVDKRTIDRIKIHLDKWGLFTTDFISSYDMKCKIEHDLLRVYLNN